MAVICTMCEQRVTDVSAAVDPRKATLMFTAGCGHWLTRDEARRAHRDGLRWHTPLIDGASLVAAERVRHVTEKGYDAAHDAQHSPTDLPWATWCLLDLAVSGVDPDADPVPAVPTMWPWEPESWKPGKSPLRALVVAGSLVCAEIDRRLAAGEQM
jgi:hypothetical protein